MSSEEASKESVLTFQELGLTAPLVRQCRLLGMTKPSPIQINCIPRILKGSDCLGCAKTGSGKTATFVLPIINDLLRDPQTYFALVLTPTRELAQQITSHFMNLGRVAKVKCVTVTGGEDMVRQGLELTDNCQVIVATPGRLADHINSGTELNFSRLKYVVLDEADRLLDDNFGEQLGAIFSVLPEKRQMLLFSATMSDSLRNLLDVADKKPFVWIHKDPVATVDGLDQRCVSVPAHLKDAYLVHILDSFMKTFPRASVMIFVITCKYCQILSMVLSQLEFQCVSLHSMLSEKLRKDALNKFKSSQVKILITTDLGSRGLDIPTVDLVINHNVSQKAENYIHRVGRTARAGKKGTSITFVTPFDVKLLEAVEQLVGTNLSKHEVDEEKVAEIALEVSVLKKEAEANINISDFTEKKEINKRKRKILMEEENSSQNRGKKTKKQNK